MTHRCVRVVLCGSNHGSSYVLPLLADDPEFRGALRADDGPFLRDYQATVGALRRDAGVHRGPGAPRLDITALLARGSRRSRQLAADLQVPLATSVASIAETPDLAVVAVPDPSGGGDIALEFLERGVSVLQEHPVSVAHVRRALRQARATRCSY
jgi:NAD-dependent oxidoreductase involved in siderophore biosynthesis